jgi:DNA-binding LytR/AlgR family response regulator
MIMMDLKCYILDDEFHAVELLRDYVEKTDGLELQGFATDPLTALKKLSGQPRPDVLFLDIRLPGLSGIEFAGLLNHDITIIFTTAYGHFALQAFEQQAFDFLLKPLSYARFYQCARRLLHYLGQGTHPENDQPDFFFVKSDIKGRMIKIVFADIVFVEGSQNYVKIHLLEKAILSYLTMREMEQFLPAGQFCRIHHSFIIHTGHLRIVEQGRVMLTGNIYLNIGRQYKARFLKKINPLLFRSKRER